MTSITYQIFFIMELSLVELISSVPIKFSSYILNSKKIGTKFSLSSKNGRSCTNLVP